jgi:hypothetical protein
MSNDPNNIRCCHFFTVAWRGEEYLFQNFWCSRSIGHSGLHGETFRDCCVVDTNPNPDVLTQEPGSLPLLPFSQETQNE